MIGMGKSETLRRVDADLARGHTHLAQQRLASLLAVHPRDLALRARRAEVYRRVGDWAQAGRWGFLTEEASPAEIAAFERALRSPSARLRALRLDGDPFRDLGPLARERYLDLVDAAKAETPGPKADDDGILTCLLVTAGLLLLLAVLVVGLWTSFDFLIDLFR
jgi:hypothetical protein